MSHQRISDSFTIENSTRHWRATDAAIGHRPQKEPYRRDDAALVYPNGNGVHVNDGQPLAGPIKLVTGKPPRHNLGHIGHVCHGSTGYGLGQFPRR
jgi:hypothetical protein